ncbi:MAG: tetratricopeptide repeat protein [Xanthobacteraceae bacterium]|nr:tetratricopeptide repeat protein [Xanthobacteraceae bacterium]
MRTVVALARISVVTGALLLISSPASFAQSDSDEQKCFSTHSDDYKNPGYYDIGLAACDRFIKSGRYRGAQLMPYVRQRADWLRRKGELDAALRDFEWAIELDPSDVENYDFRGDIFVERGEFQRAIDDYNRSIRINPNYSPAYYARGQAYEKLGRIDDAVASYRQAIQIDRPYNTSSNAVRLHEWGQNEARRRLRELGR